MPVVEVKNLQNETVEQLELNEKVFGAPLKETLIWEAVRHYQAGGRRGTHATKTRGDVSGSNRKPWRQKGTGRARAGQTRNPLWRKGGTVFGPQPRDYSYAFPKRKRQGALCAVLSEKLRQNQLVVVDRLELAAPKTKEFIGVMGALELERNLLIVDSLENTNAILSARNLPKVKYVTGSGLNIVDLLNHQTVLFSKDAILQVQEVLGK
jgi:large subunit ribosomal protein L4